MGEKGKTRESCGCLFESDILNFVLKDIAQNWTKKVLQCRKGKIKLKLSFNRIERESKRKSERERERQRETEREREGGGGYRDSKRGERDSKGERRKRNGYVYG